jgi:uncharacterized protein (TIGR03435 family)
MRLPRILAALVGVLCLNGGVRAQERFEVASIKRSAAGPNVVPAVFLPNGQWSAQRATLAMLLRSAYDLDRFVGMPAWAPSERFDIVTTASPNTPRARLQAMARTLLAERFELRAHVEQRYADVFVLARAKTTAALGPGLRPSASSCPRALLPASGVADAPRDERCTESIRYVESGALRMQLRDRPLSDLLIISGARFEVGDPIVDRTGLTDRFDIDLEFASRESRERTPDGLGLGLPYSAAVESQLGLRFDRRQEPIDVLVIELVELPSPD